MDKKNANILAISLTTFVFCLILAAFATGAEVRDLGQAPNATTATQTTSAPTATQTVSAPIVIAEPGSYRLITNILATGGNAIEIQSSFVTLDLNGFHVEATGTGVLTTGTLHEKVVVVNGSITARAGGVLLNASGCRIEHVQVSGRDGVGISGGSGAASNCIVRDNTVSGSKVGIECGGCVVSGNTVGPSGDAGISATVGSLVLGNTVSGTSPGVGLRLDDTTGYTNNVLRGNAGGDVSGGVQIGTNLCATSGICPP
jgi:parallel beta-helix repeat protein